MSAAILTVFLFAFSAVAGERTARLWGSQRGNLLRLFIATVLMGAVVIVWFPETLHGPTSLWLLASGVIGFGLGDIALFLAYTRVGARLTILLNLCTAPIWSTVVEWLWLGNRIGAPAMAAGALVLAGVALAILGRESGGLRRQGSRAFGIVCGLMAGCGQGMGAVVSRKAFESAQAAGFVLNGFSAAAQRVCGGFLATLALLWIWRLCGRNSAAPAEGAAEPARRWAWLVATTLCGPVFGVSCFQWALSTQPAGLVTSVVATTPIAMIPLAVWFDRERPGLLPLLGSLLAVVGVVILIADSR